ncbi:hypothetical protein F4804DRAFT_321827 [Jackrogersella minutella]|nr:hypothetical protein F4804DRAFT_321827 [Jackrogersella minutella]
MSAIEDVGAADSSLLEDTREEGESGQRRPDLGRLMNDPLARSMMEGFQQFLEQRDPNAAHLTTKAMRGELPGLDENERTDGGVQEGDLVVACVGGFFPYILRPRREQGPI